MGTFEFSCDLLINDIGHPLDFKILLDEVIIFDIVTQNPTYSFSHNIDNFKNHSIKFVLSGKNDSHTTTDSNGEIIESAQVEVVNISFDKFDISNLLLSDESISTYTHNSNGSTNEIVERFNTSCMGFNGVIELCTTFPISSWIEGKSAFG